MSIQRKEYTSPVEALASIIRSLFEYERKYKISSDDFFNRYQEGKMEDSADFVEWAGDYQHYINLKEELERKLIAV